MPTAKRAGPCLARDLVHRDALPGRGPGLHPGLPASSHRSPFRTAQNVPRSHDVGAIDERENIVREGCRVYRGDEQSAGMCQFEA